MAEAEGSTLAPGTRVAGRFVLERLLRRGVLAEVYLARAEGGGTARYELRRVLAAAPVSGAEQRVRAELERVARLGDRAVPGLVGVELDPSGLLVVTEAPEALVPRDTVRDLVARGERLPIKDVARLVREVARALDALHALSPSVLHRGVTPDNVSLFARRQSVWLTEAGLAHALVAGGVLTARSAVAPTEYRNPDELLQRATARGDVFALASVAYEALTGKAAFHGASEAATETAILRGPRPVVGDAVATGGDIIDAALHRAWTVEAEGGYARASEFATAVERALDSAEEPSRPFSTRTMIGIGGPPRASGVTARVTPPRATLPEPSSESSRSVPRALPPTQKVQVPRLHPPGTEPVEPTAATRDEKPPIGAPPRAPVPAAPSKDIAAVMGARISRPPGEGAPEPYEITRPVRIEPPPEAKGDIVAEASQRPSEPSPGRDSWRAVLDETSEGAAPAVDEDLVPTRPPPVPAAPTTVAPQQVEAPRPSEAPTMAPPMPSDESEVQLEEVESEPAAPQSRPTPPPAPRVSVPPPPPVASLSRPPSAPPPRPTTPPSPPEPDAAPPASTTWNLDDDDFNVSPSVPEVAVAPPAPERASEPEPAAAPPASTTWNLDADDFNVSPSVPEVEGFVPPRPPIDLEPELPAPPRPPLDVVAEPAPPPPPPAAPIAYPALAVPPPEAPKRPRWGIALGAGLVAAALVGGGLMYFRDRAASPTAPVPVPVARVDAGALAVVVDAATSPLDRPVVADVLATADLPSTDGPAASDAANADAPVALDAAAAVDVVASSDVSAPQDVAPADVPAPPPPPVDAGASAGGLAPPVITREPMRGHPRGHETNELEDAMWDEVMTCVARRHRRRVRVAVTYVGATGLASEVHISPPYNEPESGPCIERVIRRHPVGRFTAESWETGLVFDPEDE